MQGRPKLHLEYMLGRSIVDQLCKYVPTLVILYQTNSIKNMHCYCSLVLKFALCLILASVTVRVGLTERCGICRSLVGRHVDARQAWGPLGP